ncbi:AAA family ATPase, partial [Streptacidiphilus anmyonensis]|uniref:AAA family ATPase n=1 Tax=Streptacidiphilus anmyonensis TaxID=405782 RepID=UPI000A02D914
MPLYEREDALRMVASEILRTCSGSGRLVLLRGATGTGRSALLEAVAAHGAARGMRVLRARCAAERSGTEFGALRHLLEPDLSAETALDVLTARAVETSGCTAAGSTLPGIPVQGGGLPAAAVPAVAASPVAASPVAVPPAAVPPAAVPPVAVPPAAVPPAAVPPVAVPPVAVPPAAVLRSTVPDGTPSGVADADRLWRSLRDRAVAEPLLLAVDDVHLADAASRRFLAEAARQLDAVPLLIVATERAQYDVAGPAPGLARTLSSTLVRSHVLAPLSRAAAEALVRERLGARATDAWVDGCLRAGAGNPLLLHALLDDMSAPTGEGGTPARFPQSCADLYPGAYAAAVAWWLESAGPQTATVARALADLAQVSAAGSPQDASGDVGLVAGVAGADPARVSGWTTAMVRLGLLRIGPLHDGGHSGDDHEVRIDHEEREGHRGHDCQDRHDRRDDPGVGERGPVRFAHPLLRDAVLDGWRRAERQAAHREAAAFRQRRGDPAEAVAAHLLRTPATGTAWAADSLRDAASSAVRTGRTADAVALLRRALEEPLLRARRAEVLTELGALEFASLRGSAGIPRLTEALRLREEPRERIQAAVALGHAMARRGEARAAVALLHDLDADGSLTGQPVLARSVRLASALLSDHDREVRREVYDGLRETADRDPELFGPAEQALLVRYESTAGLLSADEAMGRVRTLLSADEDPLLMPYLLGTAAAVAQWADELDDADRLVRRGLAGYRLPPLHPMHQALRETRRDIAAARSDHARLLAEFERREGVWDRPGNLPAHALLALVETGRLAEAHRLATRVDVQDSHDTWELNRFLYARGVLRAASGELQEAVDDFLESGRRQTARDVLSPVVTPWRSAAAECLLALGSPQTALPLAEEEHRLAAVWGTPRVLGRALRLLGAAANGRRGLELTAQAVETLRGGGAETELAAALITQGRRLTAAGQRLQARSLLREAAAVAERAGSARLLGQAEQALRAGS